MNHDLFLEINFHKSVDLVSFFERDHTVKCPSHLLLDVIRASLKLRHTLIILENPSAVIPELHSTARWGVSESASWLSPRSLKPLDELNPLSYQELRKFLESSK